MSLRHDIKALLVAAGVNVADVFTSSKASIPEGPGPFYTIAGTSGFSGIRIHNSVQPSLIRPSVQIVVRALTSDIAETKAREAAEIVRIRNREVNSVWYLEIDPVQEPFEIGLDDKSRPRWAFNVNSLRRP